jgi:HPt (histidine-containing phosphotransfer) domain-containing protein
VIKDSGSTPNGPGGGEPAIFDREVLDDLTRHVGDHIDGLIDSVQKRLDEAGGELGAALAASDLDGVSSLAHSLKSVAGTFGASRLSSTCQELEDAARAGRADRSGELISRVADECDQSAQAIALWREERRPAS